MLVKLENHKTVSIKAENGGKSLAHLLRDAGMPLDLRCSEKGTCGKCEVMLESGSFLIEKNQIDVLPGHPIIAKACRSAALKDDCVIMVPAKAMAAGGIQSSHQYKVKALAINSSVRGLSAAIDIGTTTVAVSLVDSERGRIIGSASNYNRQIHYGDNVISRIAFADESKENLRTLQQCVIADTINPLIRDICGKAGICEKEIKQVSIAGNTVMTHLFFAISPASIGVMPFEPAVKVFPVVKASTLGIAANPDAPVIAVPAASGYIGGDVVAGVEVSGIRNNSGISVLLDIGTNCETVLFDGTKLFSCASAAGPAFEGAGIGCGCRAAAGAIERITFDSSLDFQISVIGNVQATGICGSAMIDFVAESRNCGLLNEMGRFDLQMLEKAGKLMKLSGGINACRISSGPDVYISEKDIEQILKAKSAVYAGLQTLCGTQNCKFSDITKLYLAGGFAQYINVDNAIKIGMLPAIELDKFDVIGNSSLAGAVLNAIDLDAAPRMLKISKNIQDIVLNTVPEFEYNYIDALMLP